MPHALNVNKDRSLMMKRKNDPHGPCRDRASRNSFQFDRRHFARRLQPEPKGGVVLLTHADLARRFFCAFCGKSRPESDLIGRDGRLLFCGRCVTALDALHDGADHALAVWREPW